MAKWAFLIFAALYAGAIILLLIGVFGWFGQEKDPLSAAALLPLGLPWNVLGDRLGLASIPVLVGAPALNLALLYWLWRR
jgi:hypothetical protein